MNIEQFKPIALEIEKQLKSLSEYPNLRTGAYSIYVDNILYIVSITEGKITYVSCDKDKTVTQMAMEYWGIVKCVECGSYGGFHRMDCSFVNNTIH